MTNSAATAASRTDATGGSYSIPTGEGKNFTVFPQVKRARTISLTNVKHVTEWTDIVTSVLYNMSSYPNNNIVPTSYNASVF